MKKRSLLKSLIAAPGSGSFAFGAKAAFVQYCDISGGSLWHGSYPKRLFGPR